jgi:hypothetical protein
MNLVPVGKRSLTRAIRAARRGSSRGGMAGEHHEHKNAPGVQARCAGIHHVHRLARLCGAAIDRPVAYHRLAQGHGKTCAVSGHYPAQALRGVFADPGANGGNGSNGAAGSGGKGGDGMPGRPGGNGKDGLPAGDMAGRAATPVQAGGRRQRRQRRRRGCRRSEVQGRISRVDDQHRFQRRTQRARRRARTERRYRARRTYG